MTVPYIPKELLHLILEYDGRIKYRNGKYINIIDKKDERYDIVKPLISKKREILKTIDIAHDGSRNFYFQFRFDGLNHSLAYLYRYDAFRIAYGDSRRGLDFWVTPN